MDVCPRVPVGGGPTSAPNLGTGLSSKSCRRHARLGPPVAPLRVQRGQNLCAVALAAPALIVAVIWVASQSPQARGGPARELPRSWTALCASAAA